jgi:nucleotide-binding universal stress UspA family protein
MVLCVGPIICCVDDSDTARRALEVARRLADALERPLVVVHVAPPTAAPGVSTAPHGRARLVEEELRDANALLSGIAEEAGLGDDVERIARVGDAGKVIVDLCTERRASFVVLGSRGRGGLKTAVLGSVSNSVAGDSPCPVVIVPPHAAEQR